MTASGKPGSRPGRIPTRLLAAGVLFLALFLALSLAGTSPGSRAAGSTPGFVSLEPAARVVHPPLDEISGIVKSRRYPGIYWVHNDSGDKPRIFAIREDGSVVMPDSVREASSTGEKVMGRTPWPGIRVDGAANRDWEDIALGGDILYIADTGNNDNDRRDLCIYLVLEPDPRIASRTRVLKRLPVVYPDQEGYPPAEWRFDCEAVFLLRGRIHFLTKVRGGPDHNLPVGSTTLYRLDTAFPDRPNVLTKLDSRESLEGWVTAADLSPDGRSIAVLCQFPVQSVWLFPVPAEGDRLLSGRPRRLVFTGGRQCEGICFKDDSTLVITNEQRDLFLLPTAAFRE